MTPMLNDEEPRWDAFISYASENREAVAQPLAEALTRLGLRVWYDQTELRIGDSLRERIDHGLSSSQYGIVILSPAFFAKHYPIRELNGLAQRELEGERVLLPVWYGITDRDVRRFSPPLADRIAARWDEGLVTVVTRLVEVIGQHLVKEIREAAAKIHEFPQLTSGNQLISALYGAHAHVFVHDEFRNRDEAELVGDFLQGLEDWIDALDEVGAGERARIEFTYTEELQNLLHVGWKVFGDSVMEPIGHGLKGEWPVACVAVVREGRQVVARVGDRILMRDGNEVDPAI
jgi:hypothetical protein